MASGPFACGVPADELAKFGGLVPEFSRGSNEMSESVCSGFSIVVGDVVRRRARDQVDFLIWQHGSYN